MDDAPSPKRRRLGTRVVSTLAKRISPPPRWDLEGRGQGREDGDGVGETEDEDGIVTSGVAVVTEADGLSKERTSGAGGGMIEDDDGSTEDEDEDGPIPSCAAVVVDAAARDEPAKQAHGFSTRRTNYLPSPTQLTTIRDLPPSHNISTTSLHSILSHPLLRECWQFNYLLSIPFIISHFQASDVSLTIVHGFWRRDDPRRDKLYEDAEACANVRLVAAHMPEMFGTHHAKMMVLFRRDGVAQVVIHTANMIERDWRNLTQAVWRSPELRLLPEGSRKTDDGVGERFKRDLLRYLRAYQGRTRGLIEELETYDFSPVRAVLVASVPGRVPARAEDEHIASSFGWPRLKQVLSKIPSVGSKEEAATINIQISSIATLTPAWIAHFLSILDTTTHSPSETRRPSSSFFTNATANTRKTKFNIVFPTANEIRASLDGYEAGASIHVKVASKTQQAMLHALKPMLCRWDNTSSPTTTSSDQNAGIGKGDALRGRAAPHVKSYVRILPHRDRGEDMGEVQWAMLTSANLSTQAWGTVEDRQGMVRICSYEVGVVFWPSLFGNGEGEGMGGGEDVVMRACFGRDEPDRGREGGQEGKEEGGGGKKVVVGFRMPYSLPLRPYSKEEIPWVASSSYDELDHKGNVWGGYQDS